MNISAWAMARLLCVLALLATLTPVGADTATPPKHVALAKYKRGYTFYTPAALEAEKTYPAVIWLHPLGSTMNTRIRSDWWDDLNRRKVFLVLPESADAKDWSDADVPYLLDLVNDLPNQGAVDRRKIILFGYEAGGQMAFHMARAYPGWFASLIMMSSYPVTGAKEPAVSLPPDSARRALSILMVVGTLDNGRMFCRQAAEQMDARGFAVGLIEVPDAAQAYMPSVKPEVLSWLDKVSAGQRPSVTLPEAERLAREKLKQAAGELFAEILKAPGEPEPEGTTSLKLPQAGLSVRMPPGWKLLADEPDSARLTTAVAPEGPLLVQLSLAGSPAGLARAVKDHETRNRLRGIRYTTVQASELKLGGRTWLLQEATCLSYHRQGAPGGKSTVIDSPSMLTVCYLAADPKGSEYIRVVFLCTETTAARVNIPQLVRQVLDGVRVLPRGSSAEKPVIE